LGACVHRKREGVEKSVKIEATPVELEAGIKQKAAEEKLRVDEVGTIVSFGANHICMCPHQQGFRCHKHRQIYERTCRWNVVQKHLDLFKVQQHR